MKRKLQYVRLSIIYYFGLLQMKFMEFGFNLNYFIKHKKMPRKLSAKEIEGLKRLLDELTERDRVTK